MRSSADRVDRYVGQKVQYDEEVFLQHFRSKRYLSTVQEEGNLNAWNMKLVQLQEIPGPASRFKFASAFKYQREQTKFVKYGEKLYLVNFDLKDYFVCRQQNEAVEP